MECIAPDEIEDGDLLAFVEGDASLAVQQHIAACPACYQAVQQLRQVEQLMLEELFRDSCPDVDTLLAFGANLLTAVERKPIKTHLQTCQHCQEELVEMGFKGVASPSNRVSFSSQFEAVKEKVKRILTAVPVIQPTQPVPALRGDGRQKRDVFEAGTYHIILVQTPMPALENVWQIQGQIMSRQASVTAFNGTIQLRDNTSLLTESDINQFGNFHLKENIRPGTYTLEITLDHEQIAIPDYTVP